MRKIDRTGEVSFNKSGEKMTIVKYYNTGKVLVESEKGDRKFSEYKCFKTGNVRFHEDRVGEISVNSSGEKMKILEYHDSKNVLIEFSDGTIIKAKYSHFKSGKIKNNRNRIGETGVNFYGTPMQIVKYDGATNIIVEFDDNYKYTTKTTYQYFKKGWVSNPYDLSVYGVGFLGTGIFTMSSETGRTPSYKCWSRMLERCYSKNQSETNPTYVGCTVCEEWYNFQNFAEWHHENCYRISNKRMESDKDILVKGNRIYSPETCCFVPQNINALFIKSDVARGNHYIGVSKDKKHDKFISNCSNINGKSYLGYFDTPEEAFYAYKEFKEKYIKQVAEEYKGKIPNRLYQAMINYEVEITD